MHIYLFISSLYAFYIIIFYISYDFMYDVKNQ